MVEFKFQIGYSGMMDHQEGIDPEADQISLFFPLQQERNVKSHPFYDDSVYGWKRDLK